VLARAAVFQTDARRPARYLAVDPENDAGLAAAPRETVTTARVAGG
jgi:hypothetical protein